MTVENLPLGPIKSNVVTTIYKTAKHLATLLSPLTPLEYIIKNSHKFTKIIKNTKLRNGCNMILFDVKNLFTKVPLDKAINIILRQIYQERKLDTSIPQ